MCNRINIPINNNKTIEPTSMLTIYGIVVDSVAMESRLPQDKVHKIKGLLTDFAKRKKVQLKQLQSLIGLLNFACGVIVPGRAFLRRLIDLTCGVTRPFHWIKLTCEAREDLKTWKHFVEHFNCKSVFLPLAWQSSDSISLYTDAAGAVGFAAILGTQWFAMAWPENLVHYQIAVKELFPIVLPLEIWSSELQNKKILFFTDNMAVVHVINKQSCKEKCL